MKVVFSIAFYVLFLLSAPPALLGAALLALATRRSDPDRRRVHAYVSRYMFGLLRLNPGWDVQVLHRERLPAGAAVLVANHQSMADILAAFGLFHPFKFVSKASLFAVPIVGWAMKLARYVSVERGRPRSMQRMLEECREWLRRGMAVLIFPEGTYAEPGKRLPFKRGAFLLAISERVPLVPVRLTGTHAMIEGDGPWLAPRAVIRIEVLAPISPSEFGDDEAALSSRVESLFSDL